MHRVLYVLGAITALAIVVVAVGFALSVYRGAHLDAESKAFVDSAIPAIVAHEGKEQLLGLAAPELRANVKPADLTRLFDAISQLGPLVEYEGATGEATISYNATVSPSAAPDASLTTSANYVAKAGFQNGSAVFRIGLVKRDGHWMILSFHIDPSLANRTEKGL